MTADLMLPWWIAATSRLLFWDTLWPMVMGLLAGSGAVIRGDLYPHV